MNTALIYRSRLLPISETFVRAQASALKRYRPLFVGLERSHPSLPTPADSILLANDPPLWSRIRNKIFRSVDIAPRFYQRIRSSRPSIIHAHFGPDAVMAIRLARRLKIPLVVTLHGFDVTVQRDFAAIYKELWQEATLFICVSQFIRKKAIEAGFPPEKLRVHYIGIDCEFFSRTAVQAEEKLVLFVGRFVEKKGVAYLLRAMQLVQRDNPNVRLALIGNGELRQELESLQQSLGVNCTFLGSQPRDVIRGWLERATVFCAPSVTAQNGDSEGLALVFAESQAMGTPVVSFGHGGIREIVDDGVTGLLAPERDYVGLAKAISRYLEDPDFRRRSSQAATQHARMRANLATQTNLLEDIYDAVVSGREVSQAMCMPDYNALLQTR